MSRYLDRPLRRRLRDLDGRDIDLMREHHDRVMEMRYQREQERGDAERDARVARLEVWGPYNDNGEAA